MLHITLHFQNSPAFAKVLVEALVVRAVTIVVDPDQLLATIYLEKPALTPVRRIRLSSFRKSTGFR